MIRSGVVRAAQVTANKPATIQVELNPITGCGACSSAGGCGVQFLPASPNPVTLNCQIPDDATVTVGEQVQVQLPDPDSGWLRIVCYAYGIPSLGMVIGALLGYSIATALQLPHYTESFSLAGFVAGLAGGLIAWTSIEKSVQQRTSCENRSDMARIIQER